MLLGNVIAGDQTQRCLADGGAVLLENVIAGFHGGAVLLGNVVAGGHKRFIMVGSTSLWVVDGAAVFFGECHCRWSNAL